MILLDTHALIWYLAGDPQLPNDRKNDINNEAIKCYVSIVSIWEIAIKESLKKLEYGSGVEEITKLLVNSPFLLLPIKIDHIRLLTNLPFHHRDPFDRMLIAQAMMEDLTIITKDTWFPDYGIRISWN